MSDHIESHSNIGLLPTSCGDIDGSRIIGGRVPKLYELPWMTLIAYDTTAGVDFRCAGTVINSRYILTAAHCVTDGKTSKKIAGVRVGEFDYSTDVDCQGGYDNMICESKIQDIAVEKIIPHRSFTGRQPVEADIALLRLSETINMTNNAAPICLPVYSNLRNLRLADKNATIAGWGVTETKTSSTKLLKAEIPILSNDVCSHYYNRYEHQRRSLIENMFCAGAMMKDTCDGDSGGPLTVESDFNGQIRQVQFGIVSFGPAQCGTEFPGVYTDVTKYMEWILDTIKA
nr:melanization protease 1-like [Maniola hyperantus]